MKNFIFTAFVSLLFLSTMTSFGLASDWEQFSDHLSGFYFLDGKQFDEITCEIYPSETKKLISNVRRDIEYLNLGLEVIEKDNDYKIIRKNTGEMIFKKPELEIRIPQPYYHQNIGELKKWKNNVENLYAQTIENTSVAVESIFRRFEKPNNDRIKLVLFEKAKGETTFVYEEDSVLTKKTCVDNKCVFESKVGVFTYIMTEMYLETEQGKIPKMTILKGLKSGKDFADAESTITYQTIGNFLLPEKITSNQKFSEGTDTLVTGGEILFKNCVVKQ